MRPARKLPPVGSDGSGALAGGCSWPPDGAGSVGAGLGVVGDPLAGPNEEGG